MARLLAVLLLSACTETTAVDAAIDAADAELLDAAFPDASAKDADPKDADPEDADPADAVELVDADPVDGGPAIEPGTLDVDWIHGAQDCDQSNDPPLQVHAYNASTFILRQSKCVHYEGPFIYVLFGEQRVFVQDSGATESEAELPLRQTIEDLIAGWLASASRDSIELIVTHSHAHGDHTAGDVQFEGQPFTTVVGTGVAAVTTFFGIASWPDSIVTYDLGGRTLDIIPIPGHQNAHVAVYDRATGLLLTGDSLYPGRLYVGQWDAYRDSIERLSSFAEAQPIAHVLGTHIEMSATPGVDYPIGSTFQPDEHPLQLDLTHLLELRDALRSLGGNPQREVHDSFIITPL